MPEGLLFDPGIDGIGWIIFGLGPFSLLLYLWLLRLAFKKEPGHLALRCFVALPWAMALLAQLLGQDLSGILLGLMAALSLVVPVEIRLRRTPSQRGFLWFGPAILTLCFYFLLVAMLVSGAI